MKNRENDKFLSCILLISCPILFHFNSFLKHIYFYIRTVSLSLRKMRFFSLLLHKRNFLRFF